MALPVRLPEQGGVGSSGPSSEHDSDHQTLAQHDEGQPEEGHYTATQLLQVQHQYQHGTANLDHMVLEYVQSCAVTPTCNQVVDVLHGKGGCSALCEAYGCVIAEADQ